MSFRQGQFKLRSTKMISAEFFTALDPVDEAERLRMLQQGAAIKLWLQKTGLSTQTTRRKLVLTDLCEDAKGAIRHDEPPRPCQSNDTRYDPECCSPRIVT